jgi:hypothetical protein
MKYIVKNNQAFSIPTLYHEYMVCDIDKDSHYELIYLMHGQTSGVFSFGIDALGFENDKIVTKYSNVFCPVTWYYLTFKRLSATNIDIYTQEYIGETLTPISKLYKIGVSDGTFVLTDGENKKIMGRS